MNARGLFEFQIQRPILTIYRIATGGELPRRRAEQVAARMRKRAPPPCFLPHMSDCSDYDKLFCHCSHHKLLVQCGRFPHDETRRPTCGFHHLYPHPDSSFYAGVVRLVAVAFAPPTTSGSYIPPKQPHFSSYIIEVHCHFISPNLYFPFAHQLQPAGLIIPPVTFEVGQLELRD